MTYALLVFGFAIVGFDDLKDCTDARDLVARQSQQKLGIMLCVPVPKDGFVVGKK